MLNENELNEMKAEIASINEKIKSLEARRDEIKREILADVVEKQRARYPEIQNGDKVVVTYTESATLWDKTETLYFNRVANGTYYLKNEVYWYFSPVKKDGSRAVREIRIWPDYIKDIKKVVE